MIGEYLLSSLDGFALRISSAAALDCCRKEARPLWEADMLNDLALAHEDDEDEPRGGDEEEEERRQEVEGAPCAKLDATCARDVFMGVFS